MWDWTGHMGGWWWLMAPFLVVCWALLIWGILMLVKSNQRVAARVPSAEAVLAERFARGEIDELEYRQRRALIRS